MGLDDGAEGRQIRTHTPPDPTLPTPATASMNTSDLPRAVPESSSATPSTPRWTPSYIESGESGRIGTPTSPREAVTGASSPE